MLEKQPTTTELIRIFDNVLEAIVDGKYSAVPTCTGLDQQTVNVLNQLATQPRKKASDITACRREFARMLDGTHADEDNKLIELYFQGY